MIIKFLGRFLIILISTLTTFSLFAVDVVKLAIGDWPPYTSDKDKDSKIGEKIVTEAYKLVGLDVQYSYYPWKRSYENVKQGTEDGTFPWNKNAERESDFYIGKDFMLTDEGVYFHLKSVPFTWNTIDDLKKYKVGVTIGYKNETLYKEKGIHAESVANEENNFKKMLAGRIDVYQTSKIVGYSTIKKLFSKEDADKFTDNPKVVETSKYYILFSKKSPNGKLFSDKFEEGLAKLKASGAYDKIINQ